MKVRRHPLTTRGLKEHPPYPSPRKLEHLGIEIQDSHTPTDKKTRFRTCLLVSRVSLKSSLRAKDASEFPFSFLI